MAKTSSPHVITVLKDIRAALDARLDDKARAAAATKGPIKSLGVKTATLRTVAKDILAKHKATLDYAITVQLVDASMARKVREEILVSLELLERFRREYESSLMQHVDKWVGMADDLEIAEALGTKVAAAVLALDRSKMTLVRRWAKPKSVGRRRLAVLAASGLVTDGQREAQAVLDLCELLLREDHPVLVGGVASLLRDTTKVDAKAVQDFLFRRSIDGNPDILRAGSENLDAARRAALIAKLEAQAALNTPLIAIVER
ncbi:MAG: DNA alkylation repair protein [Acidobacteria bacterium]|nr:DNA alkylation repair protein [Acidobacteriota bacterium]